MPSFCTAIMNLFIGFSQRGGFGSDIISPSCSGELVGEYARVLDNPLLERLRGTAQNLLHAIRYDGGLVDRCGQHRDIGVAELRRETQPDEPLTNELGWGLLVLQRPTQ